MQNHGPVGRAQIARYRHVIRVALRQREREIKNPDARNHRIVVRKVHHILAHNRIQIAVLSEQRLNIVVPGGRRVIRILVVLLAIREYADEIKGVRNVIRRLCLQLISQSIELSLQIAARPRIPVHGQAVRIGLQRELRMAVRPGRNGRGVASHRDIDPVGRDRNIGRRATQRSQQRARIRKRDCRIGQRRSELRRVKIDRLRRARFDPENKLIRAHIHAVYRLLQQHTVNRRNHRARAGPEQHQRIGRQQLHCLPVRRERERLHTRRLRVPVLARVRNFPDHGHSGGIHGAQNLIRIAVQDPHQHRPDIFQTAVCRFDLE